MITEDYISFEVAKLLKEKGFDGDIILWYDEDGKMFYKHKYDINRAWRVRANQEVYECPTMQMVMKWLREVYKLNIQPCIVRTLELKKAYNATIYDDNCEQIKSHFGCNIFCGFPTYEEACEAAIKYCLTNLI